jgi:hypothetical protein
MRLRACPLRGGTSEKAGGAVIAMGAGEALGLLWGPGIVFLVILIWLLRRVIRAARTESRLEEERLREWMKGEVAQLQSTKAEPRLMRVPPPAEREKNIAARAVPGTESIVPMQEARAADIGDRTGVTETELAIVRPLFQGGGPGGSKVLWVRSTGSHIAFCERREAPPPSKLGRDVITIVKVVEGKVVGKWQFG